MDGHTDVYLTVPNSAWRNTGSDEDPSSRLLATLNINGLWMHLEALAVKLEPPDGDGYQDQVAADPVFAGEVSTLQEMQQTSFQTTTLFGREYILVATPHGD